MIFNVAGQSLCLHGHGQNKRYDHETRLANSAKLTKL